MVTLHKVIGRITLNFNQVLLATFVVGIVRTLVSLVVLKIKKQSLLSSRSNIIGACLFGTFATFNTILPFTIFLLDGDMGINVFIFSLGIVLGALVDKFFFKHRLLPRQWFGILVAIFAGYSILGWPSLQEFLNLPLWVWLSFLMLLFGAANQGLDKKIRTINPLVKNFWGGLMHILIALIFLAALKSLPIVVNFSQPLPKIWLVATVISLISVLMWIFGVLSYKAGANIAFKNLITSGSFLVMAMILGIVIFNEPATWSKLVGVILYFIAFGLMNMSKKQEPL